MKRSPFALLLIAVLLSGCGTNRFLGANFGSSPIGQAIGTTAKIAANQAVANSPACKNPAPIMVSLCMTAMAAADAFVMLAFGVPMPEPPPAAREGAEEDARVALQKLYESVGYSPAEAAKRAAELPVKR